MHPAADFKPPALGRICAHGREHAPQITHTLRLWAVRGLGGGVWRQKRLPRKTLLAGNTVFMAVSQTLRCITHARFSKMRRTKKQKEKENKYKGGYNQGHVESRLGSLHF